MSRVIKKDQDFDSSIPSRGDSISSGAEERKRKNYVRRREWFGLIEALDTVVEKQEIRFQGRLKR